MFRTRRRPADRIRFARIRFLRSIPLPAPAIPTTGELSADAETTARRMHSAGALDRFTPQIYDAELDTRLADAVTALRTEAMEQTDVEDRLVDQARVQWRRERLERQRLEEALERRIGSPGPAQTGTRVDGHSTVGPTTGDGLGSVG